MKHWSSTIVIGAFCIFLNPAKSDDDPGTEEKPLQPICSRMCHEPDDLKKEKYPSYMCSCSPSCALYGDCCFDSKYRSASPWEETQSICLSVAEHGNYQAVSGCPTNQISGHCKAAIGHLPPVTSKLTNITYANIFCASCNGDFENLLTWNVELRCISDEIEESSNETYTIVYRFGNLWKFSESTRSRSLCLYHVDLKNYSLLDSLELRYCDREENLHECSLSWTDTDVIKLCRSYEDPVYFGDKVYRNLHCAICNYLSPNHAKCMPHSLEIMLRLGIKDPRRSSFCRQRRYHFCGYYQVQSKGRPYSFASLMNIHEEVCIPPKGRKCCLGERYDYSSKRCRKVVRN